MKSLSLIAMLSLMVVLSGAAVLDGDSLQMAERPASDKAAVRFDAVELWVDCKDQPLAAYQIEFKPVGGAGDVKIVGIEGGEHTQFANPPYYDPKAMMSERVIIAAFSTARAESLPTGRIRIARIHVQISGKLKPKFETILTVVATSNGNAIAAEVDIK